MKPQTLETARLALATNVNRPLLEYFEERLLEHHASLMSCSESTFRQYQGRAQECEDMIKLLKSARG